MRMLIISVDGRCNARGAVSSCFDQTSNSISPLQVVESRASTTEQFWLRIDEARWKSWIVLLLSDVRGVGAGSEFHMFTRSTSSSYTTRSLCSVRVEQWPLTWTVFFFNWTRKFKWYWLVEQMNLLSNSLNYGHGTWWSSSDQSWVEAGHRAGHRTKSGGTRVAGHLILAWAELSWWKRTWETLDAVIPGQCSLVCGLVRGWEARVETQSSDKYDLISNKNHYHNPEGGEGFLFVVE